MNETRRHKGPTELADEAEKLCAAYECFLVKDTQAWKDFACNNRVEIVKALRFYAEARHA